MKPRIFVGSSTESLNIAYAIQELLPEMEVTVWSQGIFQLSSNILDDLVQTLDKTDFGVFVFSPEDLLVIRDQQYSSARDNVVFELGLFIGRLGKQRSFFVVPQDRPDFHLPSDLLGVNPATFNPNRQDKNLRAALGPAANQIRTAVEKSSVDGQLIRKLTSRSLYLLRHLESGESELINDFGNALATFDEFGRGPKPQKSYENFSEAEKQGWAKASEYAFRFLEQLGLIELQTRTVFSVRINDLGRSVLNSQEIKTRFDRSFKVPLTPRT